MCRKVAQRPYPPDLNEPSQVGRVGEMASKKVDDWQCSVARSITVLGERWTILILREALLGTTRFVDFERNLGLPSDRLVDRLATLVEYDVMTKESYQQPGQRRRPSYHLTPAGRELHVLIGALQQWGDQHLPRPEGPTMVRKAKRTERPVHVAFIDDLGYEVSADDVATIPTGN
jgi:DNA-binding HxlR family transcriptional regulator